MRRVRRRSFKRSIKVAIGGGMLFTFIVVILFTENSLLQSIYNPSTLSSAIRYHGNLHGFYNVALLNQKYKTVDEILDWICSSVTNHHLTVVSVTNWGPSSLVILHHLEQKENCDIPVVTIDTLHMFPESYDFIKSQQAALDNFSVYRPNVYTTQEAFDNHFGEDFYQTNPQQYAYWTKIEPTHRALRELQADAWITGRRKSQGGERSTLQAFELDTASKQRQRLKINPLVDWTYDEVWEYIRSYNISYNPLYDLGYKSLGDVNSTSTVAPDAEERSGRFQGLNQSECGMHNLRMLSPAESDADGNKKGSDFVELNRVTLDTIVLQDSSTQRGGKDNIFIVFYHLQCSHCRHFEPIFFELAKLLKDSPDNSTLHNIVVTRYNVGRYRLPQKAKQLGFQVAGTPALFLVQHKPTFRLVQRRSGSRNAASLLRWLEEEVSSNSTAT
jgi:phosphoadenosine phosphosulfate reductase